MNAVLRAIVTASSVFAATSALAHAPVRQTPRAILVEMRLCGGSCVKKGSLSWVCPASRDCAINCAVSPPSLLCR